jgi:hypothetical protein
MMVKIHRRDQCDLSETRCAVKPLIACHVQRGYVIHRLFVLWRNGFRGFGLDVRWCMY